MTTMDHRTLAWLSIFFLIVSLSTISHVYADGRHVSDKSNLAPKPEGTLKSIEVPEDGDVIDCVLIHKQPAFDHPLIKDLQGSREQKTDDQPGAIYQNWHKYGECPEGTIPIRRTRSDDIHEKLLNLNMYAIVTNKGKDNPGGPFYQGAVANISLWNPKVESRDFSAAQVSVQSGFTYDGTLTSLIAGWIVYPQRYHDTQSRLFIHWTPDDYQTSRGCFDLDCPGFVQLDNKYAIGVPIKPTSTYNGSIFEARFSIYKSPKTGNWNFEFQGVLIGYWPASIVPGLRDHAQEIVWGADVMSPRGPNTTTQMGNGHLSKEAGQKSAFMRSLQVFNNDYKLETPNRLWTGAIDSKCYDITIGKDATSIYYGGFGFSSKCNYTLGVI